MKVMRNGVVVELSPDDAQRRNDNLQRGLAKAKARKKEGPPVTREEFDALKALVDKLIQKG